MKQLIEELKNSNKPNVYFLSAKDVNLLKDPNCLSVNMTVFRNGGSIDGEAAIAFVEATPQLIALLRAIYS